MLVGQAAPTQCNDALQEVVKHKLMVALLSLVSVLVTTTATSAAAQTVRIPNCEPTTASQGEEGGLSLRCQLEFASRFAPVLVVRAGGCNWEARKEQLGGGYFFAVQRVDSVVRVAYLPAYFEDCGWYGIKCWIPGVDCTPHRGDSEFIVVELQEAPARAWRVTGVFLSAHCFGRSVSDCRWYRGKGLERFQWQDTSPIVWVSDGRNANYPSRRACDMGHHSLDTCDRNNVQYRYPVAENRNIGSRSRPARQGGCVSGSEVGSPVAEPEALECFWDANAKFRGWKTGVAGVTGYFRYLVEIAGF